jgi:hypothetical protein
MTYDVKTNVTIPKQVIKPEMLVAHAENSAAIGLVVQVTRKWVHVLWLVNPNPGSAVENTGSNIGEEEDATFWNTRGQHHFVSQERRQDLTILPAGTKVTVTQTIKA